MTDETTGIVAICNRALAEIGALNSAGQISDLTEDSEPAAMCRLFYDTLRKQLLRAAPWNFARRTALLTTLGTAATTPPSAPYPYVMKYEYPPDCLKMRYIIPPYLPVTTQDVAPDVSVAAIIPFPWCAPSRTFQFLPSYEAAGASTPARKVILANIPAVWGVYTADVTEANIFDDTFANALSMLLANKLVIPLSGNVGMKRDYVALAMDAVTQARAADANEAISRADNTPTDWIAARNVGGPGFGGMMGSGPVVGQTGYPGWSWYDGWDAVSWGN